MSSPEARPLFRDDPDAWRAGRRRELLALREALDPNARRAGDERIASLLAEGFPFLERMIVGFYWPFRGEVDARRAAHRLRTKGARTALPVVVAKARPLEFREWCPGAVTSRGALGLPVPLGTPVLAPEALLVPPVGFDARGYRLGYGGGFFDRTLAAAAPRPLAIGLAREASRMDTIHPQAHDVPMDYIVTEAGIHRAGGEALRRIDAAEAREGAHALLEGRRRMTTVEIGALLNTLLEAERAGAAVLGAFIREVDLGTHARAEMRRIQRDEAHNCGVLIGLLAGLGIERSLATGDFVHKALAVEGAVPRLEFLNRGQAWVERRIAQALPRISEARVRRALEAMRVSHVANIAACEALVAGTRASPASSNGA
jgi:5,10-methenyltetrahydrofolate synthetase